MTATGRLRVARGFVLAAAAALLTASCTAGQHAQTTEVQPSIDGAHATLGTMRLQGVAIAAPTGSSYAANSNVPLAITLVNEGSSDTLVNVTSTDFTGWGIVDNADAATASASSGADTGLTIDSGSVQRLSLVGQGASADLSPRTLLLMGLTRAAAPLFPGSSVDITFRFANAGSTTLHVPVQITAAPAPSASPVG